jgi:hypothetical protein
MRLAAVENDHPLTKRLIHFVIRRQAGRVADVLLTLDHRPKFFGDPFSQWTEQALRGPSEWTQGERELMAALVSARNQCVF